MMMLAKVRSDGYGVRQASQRRASIFRAWVLGLALALAWNSNGSFAEYADVILNRYSDREDVRPVIFPHWFHRIRYQCRVCHSELGFTMRAGSNDITMDKITAGSYCGACHNGEIAWSADNCDLCHSAVRGTPTGTRGGHQTSGPGRY
jgi:c(7)-type cytochrome triheme protein